jgi:hypothetical protein
MVARAITPIMNRKTQVTIFFHLGFDAGIELSLGVFMEGLAAAILLPQSVQNFALSGNSAPHAEQNIICTSI